MKLTIAFCLDSVTFTPDVIAGTASLGGSESACLGLARALRARGHDVHLFVTKIDRAAADVDHAGVRWHDARGLQAASFVYDWDVLVALRQPSFLSDIPAKFKVLWTQDLMAGEAMKNFTMSQAFAYDAVAYVSQYHQKQWEDLAPELQGIGYVTRNGFDPALVPKDVTKAPNRIIHISRPERGLSPLLAMWPALRQAEPTAELHLCRYSSMYDPQGWGEICAQFDRQVERVNRDVGGITYLGELGKPALYRAIAEAAVMWYPGVATFGETSCIAAIESQACGTPFVGSFKGALPETVPSGVLIRGDAQKDPAYHAQAIAAVRYALEGCRKQTFGYRQVQQQGRQHVRTYTYAGIAAEWEAWLLASFRTRYETKKRAVLARLLHEDDHVTAKVVAGELGETQAVAFCDFVIAGKDHSAETYAAFAADPIAELNAKTPRTVHAVNALEGAKRVLDVACGPGAFALAFAQADPERHVTAIDYSPQNIEAGRRAAEQLGLSDQITWIAAEAWDNERQQPSAWLRDRLRDQPGQFDGLFCGEFLEHVGEGAALVRALDRLLEAGARVCYTVPLGPLTELVPRQTPLHRGHVHHFRPPDLDALFGAQDAYRCAAMPWDGRSPAGSICGNWLITFRTNGQSYGDRPLDRRILTRPRSTITAGLIVNDTIDLRRCLDAVWPVVDEIVIGNCGADEAALAAVVAEFPRKTRVVPVGPVASLHGGFSEARNRVLAEATTEWFFWIDADEVLCGGHDLQKYLDSVVYHGYIVLQQHLQLDAANFADRPVRVFRRRPDIEFYGCVHEQPQMGDCNTDIMPGLQIGDVQIAHTGYLHEALRRHKALHRNLPLLARDQEVFPTRELGRVLVLRDYANLALWEQEAAGGRMTETVKAHRARVIALFEEYFADPTHRYHALARPFYDGCLRDIAGAIEIEIGVMGAEGGLNGEKLTTERVWVRTTDHLKALLQSRVDALVKSVTHPPALAVEPVVPIAPVVDTEALPLVEVPA